MQSTFWGVSARKNICLDTCTQKQAKILNKVYAEVSFLRTKKYFDWIIKQLLNSDFVMMLWKIVQISVAVVNHYVDLKLVTHVAPYRLKEFEQLQQTRFWYLFQWFWKNNSHVSGLCGFVTICICMCVAGANMVGGTISWCLEPMRFGMTCWSSNKDTLRPLSWLFSIFRLLL